MAEVLKDEFGRQLLMEPVTRPDGRSIWMWGRPEYRNSVQVEIMQGDRFETMSSYAEHEVKRLGEKNFTAGLIRIGHEYYKAPEKQFLPGMPRALDNEIRR